MVLFCQSKAELYLEVKGSFFRVFLRKHINCVHNCEDHSSFDFISAFLIYIYYLLFISYTSVTCIYIINVRQKSISLVTMNAWQYSSSWSRKVTDYQ